MFYFAFGSLLDQERLRELSPTAFPLRRAKIPHHALCFTGCSQAWGGGTATIGLAPNRDLWGGLYEIDEEGRAAIERSGAEDGYVWAFTLVEDIHGEAVTAGVLVKVRNLERSPPSDLYLEALKAGWLQWGLDPKEMLKEPPPAI
jgi:hypothetical protein